MNSLLTAVIPTKNEAANIVAAVSALVGEGIETIVVDNFSTDGTASLASEAGAKVVMQGPERSAQRNRGAKEASSPWVVFLDADMILPPETLREIVSRIAADEIDGLWVREHRVGAGIRAKARDFERSFYDGTVVDAVRVVRRDLFMNLGGYDETITGNEDWDLDIRLKAVGARLALTDSRLIHNEKLLSLGRVLAKKKYYSGTFERYKAKWPGNEDVRKQFSFSYRYFGVFFENGKWRKVLRHPVLWCVMMFERVLVGAVYLFSGRKQARAT